MVSAFMRFLPLWSLAPLFLTRGPSKPFQGARHVRDYSCTIARLFSL